MVIYFFLAPIHSRTFKCFRLLSLLWKHTARQGWIRLEHLCGQFLVAWVSTNRKAGLLLARAFIFSHHLTSAKPQLSWWTLRSCLILSNVLPNSPCFPHLAQTLRKTLLESFEVSKASEAPLFPCFYPALTGMDLSMGSQASVKIRRKTTAILWTFLFLYISSVAPPNIYSS